MFKDRWQTRMFQFALVAVALLEPISKLAGLYPERCRRTRSFSSVAKSWWTHFATSRYSAFNASKGVNLSLCPDSSIVFDA